MTGLCRPVECSFLGVVDSSACLVQAWHVSGPNLARARSRFGKSRDEIGVGWGGEERRRACQVLHDAVRLASQTYKAIRGRSVKEVQNLQAFYFERSFQSSATGEEENTNRVKECTVTP